MAFKAMHRYDLIEKINYERLYEELVVFYHYYRNLAYKLSSNKVRLFVKSSFRIVIRYRNAFKRLLYQRFFHRMYSSDMNVAKGINNIIEANDFLVSKVGITIFQD